MSFQSVVINEPQATGAEGAIASDPVVVKEKQYHSLSKEKPDTNAYALRVVDLSKSFKSGFLRKKIRGIDGISFTVRKGEVFGILGHNGAGKTTTINCILDLVHPDRGEIDILGQDYQNPISRQSIGYLPERPYFFEHLSGKELLQFYGKLLDLPKETLAHRVGEVLERLGMSDFQNRKLKKYSKGMLQRIGLAQAILGKPELLILDEPMSGLDPKGRKDVRELILELKASGCTIILASHIVPDVEMIADSIMVIKEGQVALQQGLSAMSGGSTYSVSLAHQGVSVSVLPSWAQQQFIPSDSPYISVNADSVLQLQEILAASHTHNILVQSVETHRTGLEDLFMKVNNTQEAHS